MTDEHHPDDVARAKEATRIVEKRLRDSGVGVSSHLLITPIATEAARLGREGWKPPVDPDLLLARKCTAEAARNLNFLIYAGRVERGERDGDLAVPAALRAIKITRGEAQ